MKSKAYNRSIFDFLFIGVFALLTGCNWLSPCGECFTPPDGLGLLVLDELTGENLLKPGVYNPDSVRFYYISNQTEQDINFDIYGDDSLRQIVSFDIGFISTGPNKTFFLELNHEDTDTIYMDTQKITEDCCTWHQLNKLEFNGQQPDFNSDYYSWILYKSTHRY